MGLHIIELSAPGLLLIAFAFVVNALSVETLESICAPKKKRTPKQQRKGDNMSRKGNLFWNFYTSGEHTTIPNCGKWTYFFNVDGLDFVNGICEDVIARGVVSHVKHTSSRVLYEKKSGVVCFYIDGTDRDSNIRVLKYFMEKGLIPRNKNGNYRNISFKFDEQTYKGQYGEDFKSVLKLSDFVDVTTGEFY